VVSSNAGSVGFDDTQEATGPCGSFTVDFTKDNISDFHVGGDTVYLTGTHPTTTFLYRATTDQTASGNWSDLLSGPIQVVGIGDNCQPLVPVPAGFAGSKGVVQIVADSPDGILYQVSCSAQSGARLTLDSARRSTSSPARGRRAASTAARTRRACR
jgi:hypothetical protein